MRSKRFILRRSLVRGIAWVHVCVLALGVLTSFERSARLADLTAESERFHTFASQRVDQHDAHLTAIAVAGAEQRSDLFREVAGAIIRFYSWIIGISLMPLDVDDSY